MVVNIRPLSAALAERARIELNEKPNEIEARIKELRLWILQQPHLKARTGETWIRHDVRDSKQQIIYLILLSLAFFLSISHSVFSAFLCRRSVFGVIFARQQIRHEFGQTENRFIFYDANDDARDNGESRTSIWDHSRNHEIGVKQKAMLCLF